MKNLLQNIIKWIKKYSFLLKLIFISSVMFFVINQLANILHGMTFSHFLNLIKQQGIFSILIMAIVGFIAVLPMILYDYGTVKLLKLNLPKRKIINDGWIINTINNLAGFGGVVGVSLRMNRYGKLKKDKQTAATITKTALFMLTGISILSFLMFIYLALNPNSPFINYWSTLLLGSCFAPGLLIFIKRTQRSIFIEFTNKLIAIFYLASLGQWLGAMTIFLVIGHLLVPNISLIQIAPLFVTATLLGMISMIPGGMGTFDILIILGLHMMGIPKTVAVIWILFYRVFYYILPFISGSILLIHQTGRHINQVLDDLPHLLLTKGAHLFITCIMYLAGIMTIVISTMPNLTLISHFFDELLPFSFALFDQTLNMMIGLLLIGLARGVYNKVKRAYDLSMIILIFCIVNTLLSRISLQFVILYGFVFFCLYVTRDEFYREKFVYSWGALFFDAIIMGIIFVTYAAVGFLANKKEQMSKNFFLFPSDDVWFSGLAGLILAIMILIALYHYLSTDRYIGEVFNETRIKPFLNNKYYSYYQQMVYLKDYKFYYYQVDHEDKVCFMFQTKANRCIVLGSPLGEEKYYKEALEDFMTSIDIYNYQPVFYNVDQKFSLILHDLGYQFMKISELGSYLPQEVNRDLSKQTTELSVSEVYECLDKLEEISKTVEQDKNFVSFSIAKYTRDFVLSSKVLTYQIDGKIKAYCVLSQPRGKKVSLMYIHSICDEQTAIKDFMKDILTWCDENKFELQLGYSPLANVGTSQFSFLEERLIHLLYIYGEKMTQFEQTNKALSPYVNNWKASYLAYPSHQNFFIVILQVALLIFKQPSYNTRLI